MYEPETILVLKEPRSVGTPPVGSPDDEDYKPASEDYSPFPYDRVRVVGQSPINHGAADSSWEGPSGQGVIITPLTDFGSTLDEPYGKLQQMYDVESLPVHEAPREAPVRVINSSSGSAGPTPEEVFSKEAPGKASKDGKRGRSPLGEAVVPESSPLGAGDKSE